MSRFFKYWKYRVALILVGAGINACLPDPLEVDGLPVVKPQIVVSSQIFADQSLVVFLTRTFGALEATDDSDIGDLFRQIAVADATVIIAGPQRTDTLFALTDGVYGGIVIPFQEGDVYTLQVLSPTLGEVTATTTVMATVGFDEIEATLYYNGFDDTLAQISHTITDPAGQNRYLLNVQEIEQEDLIENLLNPRAFTRLLEDETFDGQTYSEVFRVIPRDFAPGDTIAVSISNISEAYYQFLRLRQDNRFSLLEYLSEPINYPSNVSGGKGFFNLYTPDLRVFQLE